MRRCASSGWVALVAVAAASLIHVVQAETGAVRAQQRAQTDLDFARERARVTAAERRIAVLRGRLAGLERAAAGDHVILGRDAGPPPAAGTGGARPVRAARPQQPADAPERRIPETLTHRTRLVTASEAEALRGRLDAAARTARTLGERLSQPDFGAGLRALERELDALGEEIAGYE